MMLTNPSTETLKALKLQGMLEALEEQQKTPSLQAHSFEERVALLVDLEGCIATTNDVHAYCEAHD